MDPIEETTRRLIIAKDISIRLEGIVDGVMLGGSMGYGANHSVNENSDIDMSVVVSKKNFDRLMNTSYFTDTISSQVQELFYKNKINLFWITKTIDGVEVNTFVYSSKDYKEFCKLNGGIKGYINHKPRSQQSNYGFDGNLLTFDRNVRAFDEGYIYEKPALVNGKFWGGPPRQDFLYSGFVLYEKNGFFTKLEPEVWAAAVKQLVKEYGKNPDLTRYNLLNAYFTYQTARDRLPQAVISKISQRTIDELEKLNSIKLI